MSDIFPEFQEKIQLTVNKLLSKLETGMQQHDSHDYSIYTGSSGVALLYLLLGQRLNNVSYIKLCIHLSRGMGYTFHGLSDTLKMPGVSAIITATSAIQTINSLTNEENGATEPELEFRLA
ncbi:hypothetical protein C0J52_03231 [Blattella germanica]|nr:hypothetical protein C0J52_03231 [Blattella germanica]